MEEKEKQEEEETEEQQLKDKNVSLGKLSLKKNGKKRGHCPLLATPPLNGSKGDICCLITDKSA